MTRDSREDQRAESKAIADDLVLLRARFRELGLNEKPTEAILALCGLALFLGLGGLAVFVFVGAWPLRLVGFAVSTFGFLMIATLGHTASHDAVSERSAINRLVGFAAYPLLLGMSARYWYQSHVQIHHPGPNVVGKDDDCDLRPLFALNEEHVNEAPARLRPWFRIQGYVFPFVLPLNGINIHRQGWMRLIGELRDPKRRNVWSWVDLGCLVLHLVLWIVVPMAFFPASLVLAVYALRILVLGTALFAILAPGHFPSEAVCVSPELARREGFVFLQTAGTINFRAGFLGGLLCSGLQYQIEHHLFPRLSHLHYAKASPLVKELCRKHELPYREFGWGEAIWKSYLVFFSPKPVWKELSALRTALGQNAP